jgi:uncharacterized protein YeaC (DUF1315 family)
MPSSRVASLLENKPNKSQRLRCALATWKEIAACTHSRAFKHLQIVFPWTTRHEKAKTKGQEKKDEQHQFQIECCHPRREMAWQNREALPEKKNSAAFELLET